MGMGEMGFMEMGEMEWLEDFIVRAKESEGRSWAVEC